MGATLLLVLAAVSAAAWLAALAVLGGTSASAPVEPAPGVFEPPGSEPPAVVNLLVNRWKLTPDAVPATILDLAARGLLELREDGPDALVLRLPGEPGARPGGLTGFERRLFEQVQRTASRGEVPVQALRSGPKDKASAWWSRFERDVLADARARGLSRDRWGRRRGLVSAALLVPVTCTWLAMDRLIPSTGDNRDDLAFAGGAALGVLGLVLLQRLRAERDTPAGRAAAAQWLGLRQTMAADPGLAAMTPALVRDRRGAYAAAFGLAPGVSRPLSFGASEDDVAWSAYGGSWRQVSINYPKGRRAWGWTPLRTAATAVGYSAMALLWLWIAQFFLRDGWEDGARWFFIGGLVAALASLLVLWNWIPALLAALADLSSQPRQLEGLVLRLRRYHIKPNRDSTTTTYRDHYVAVDSGGGERVDAWWVPRPVWDQLQEGQMIRFSATPRLGCVRGIQVVGGQPEPPTSQLLEP
jgi:hypothetical protein